MPSFTTSRTNGWYFFASFFFLYAEPSSVQRKQRNPEPYQNIYIYLNFNIYTCLKLFGKCKSKILCPTSKEEDL